MVESLSRLQESTFSQTLECAPTLWFLAIKKDKDVVPFYLPLFGLQLPKDRYRDSGWSLRSSINIHALLLYEMLVPCIRCVICYALRSKAYESTTSRCKPVALGRKKLIPFENACTALLISHACSLCLVLLYPLEPRFSRVLMNRFFEIHFLHLTCPDLSSTLFWVEFYLYIPSLSSHITHHEHQSNSEYLG